MSSFHTIEWVDGKVVMIDQTKLPGEETYVECSSYEDVARAIKTMVIRGAPAIGVAAGMGIALGALKSCAEDRALFISEVKRISDVILKTRPTAVNLSWAVKRMLRKLDNLNGDIDSMKAALVAEARDILEEDISTCREIGRVGEELINDNSVVLTHCNAGALATGGYGTALGVIRGAFEQGKKIKVIATETRPFLQGARLTAWELNKDGIPVSLITDNMAGYVMQRGMVDAVVLGADRIARNGDVANKIGTYTISVLAKENKVPFYVAAPLSTVDYDCPDGEHIPIEQRDTKEVTHIAGKHIAPDVSVLNPAFDITPHENVSAIITEAGVAREPFSESLSKMAK